VILGLLLPGTFGSSCWYTRVTLAFFSFGASARALPSAEFLFGRTRGWSDRRCGGCSCQARKAGIEGRELLYDDLRRRKLRLPSGYRRDCYRPARELITTAVNPELRDYDSL